MIWCPVVPRMRRTEGQTPGSAESEEITESWWAGSGPWSAMVSAAGQSGIGV